MGVALLMGTTFACTQRDTVSPNDEQGCTKEAQVCPDGSSVARVGPDCEFEPCPGEALPESAEDLESAGADEEDEDHDGAEEDDQE
jgi:hypothetical protein